MNIKHIGSSVASLITMGLVVSVATGCAPQAQDSGGVSTKNLVRAGDPNVVKTIGDQNKHYTIMARGALKDQIRKGIVEVIDSLRVSKALKSSLSDKKFRFVKTANRVNAPDVVESDTELMFGMPVSEFNKPMIFGSVITQVSDQKNPDLGNLKLADLPPFQVLTIPHKKKDGGFGVALLNCAGDCSKIEGLKPLIDIPVVGIDPEKNLVFLDLASLGQALDLAAIRRGDPSLEKFKSKASKTVKFDYSQSTLVFDVEAHLIDEAAKPDDESVPVTLITNRWYLRTTEGLNPNFVTRPATPGVGFFMTEREKNPLIQRWDFDLRGENEGIKYYIKHVPAQFQAAFASSFDEWNRKLRPIIGKKVFDYEFISEEDPRNELLVAGDVRYNVMEWDLVNKASYGGLGPSIANPYSGEVFHANVLVQGPTIVELYTRWFNAQQRANELRSEGKNSEADLVLTRTHTEIQSEIRDQNTRTFEMTFARDTKLRIRAQDPSYEDPVMSRDDFDPVPEGYEFDTYMYGYFHDMVTHELGHDLGLRHNFKGNLGAAQGTEVSRSIMEYLGRGYRHLDKIGEYDLMAMSYGYAGVPPTHVDWYCTDEDATRDLTNPEHSPECTPTDATEDPFSFFVSRFNHALDLIVAKGSTAAPIWTLEDLKTQLQDSVVGVGSYALGAEKTASSWTNFFKSGGDRPVQASEVKTYVLNQLKSILCNPGLANEIASKENEEAKSKTSENLSLFKTQVTEILKPVFKAEELACATQ